MVVRKSNTRVIGPFAKRNFCLRKRCRAIRKVTQEVYCTTPTVSDDSSDVERNGYARHIPHPRLLVRAAGVLRAQRELQIYNDFFARNGIDQISCR